MDFNAKQYLIKLDALRAISGKGAAARRQEVIETFTPAEQQVTRMALDPTFTYYMAELSARTSGGADELQFDPLMELLWSLSMREITGNTAEAAVSTLYNRLHPDDAEVLNRVITKNLKAGVGATAVNKVFNGLVTEFPYMRCSLPKDVKLATWEWEDGIISQLKANGSFVRIAVREDGATGATTRQGNQYPRGDALAHLLEDAAWAAQGDSVEFHGELLVYGPFGVLPRSEGNGILNSLLSGGELPAGHSVRMDAWDVIPLAQAVVGGQVDIHYGSRLAELARRITGTSAVRTMQVIEYKLVYSWAEARAHALHFMKQGLEGTVIKRRTAPWRDGDSRDQVKIKLEVDVDLRIVGFTEGTKGTRTEHTFGSVMLETLCGSLKVSASGLKRDLELWLHENRDAAIGMIMAVRANEISPPCETNEHWSLYHPRVIELRRDKDTADTLEQVRAQFEKAVSA